MSGICLKLYLISLILINYLISMPLKELFKVLKMLYCSLFLLFLCQI